MKEDTAYKFNQSLNEINEIKFHFKHTQEKWNRKKYDFTKLKNDLIGSMNRAFVNAKNEEEKIAILSDLNLMIQLLKNPSPETIEACLQRAENQYNSVSPLEVFLSLGIILLGIPTLYLVMIAFVALSMAIPLGTLAPVVIFTVSMAITAVFLSMASGWLLLTSQGAANDYSSSIERLTRKVADSDANYQLGLFSSSSISSQPTEMTASTLEF